MFEKYRTLRLEGVSPPEARAAVSVSAGASYKYERKLEAELGEAYSEIESDHARKMRRFRSPQNSTSEDLITTVVELRQQLASLKEAAPPRMKFPNPSWGGSVAEDFAIYRFRRNGIETHRPTYPVSGTDFFVAKGSSLSRCEVKSTTIPFGDVEIRCTRHRKGGLHLPYEEGLVDFFVLVDLPNEHLFILPSTEVAGTATYTLSPGGRVWQFRDRYDLMGM